MREIPAYLRHMHWYVGSPSIPLVSPAETALCPRDGFVVRWPRRYAWKPGAWRLDLVVRELKRLARVEASDIPSFPKLHTHGGFPVPASHRREIGQPGYPKDEFDIRGELFEIRCNHRWFRCAYDYSDYPVISTPVAAQVDLYFKCVAPAEDLPSNVVPAGYFPRRAALLAKARRLFLNRPAVKTIDVYARFGSWTDSQDARARIVQRLQNSDLRFTGGFDTRIYPAYLRELLRARIAVEAPGQGPLSYRLVEAMALGAVVICAQPKCRLPEPLLDGVHYIRMREDASDLVDLCRALLHDEPRRSRIAAEGLAFFDRNFAPASIARRILSACVERTASIREMRLAAIAPIAQ